MPSLDFFKNRDKIFLKRRGLSQIIASLLMLAIVVPIGSVILVNGMGTIAGFNNSLSNTIDVKNEGIQEDLVFEHVRFDPSDDAVEITIKNIGSVETIIDRVTLVNMTSQNVLFSISGVGTFDTDPILIKDSRSFVLDPVNLEDGCIIWNCGSTTNWEYKISIITSRGNFFDTVVRPYNT
jgi:hypothetical protein